MNPVILGPGTINDQFQGGYVPYGFVTVDNEYYTSQQVADWPDAHTQRTEAVLATERAVLQNS